MSGELESNLDEDDHLDFDSVETAIEAIRAGKMVIVVDARDRENEGDFICAAESITPEMVNFMLRQGGGMLCVPLVDEVVQHHVVPGSWWWRGWRPDCVEVHMPFQHLDVKLLIM